jgi:hypothetical protein
VFAPDVLGYPRGGTARRYEEHRRDLVGSHRPPPPLSGWLVSVPRYRMNLMAGEGEALATLPMLHQVGARITAEEEWEATNRPFSGPVTSKDLLAGT